MCAAIPAKPTDARIVDRRAAIIAALDDFSRALAPEVNGRRRVLCCHSARLSGRFPPNALAAVDECVSARVPRLEVDVRFMADDSMVIMHDSVLDYATTGVGRLDGLSRMDLAGIHYKGAEEHPICFLEDVVARVRGSATLLQVDLKAIRPLTAARRMSLIEALKPLRDQVIVGSQAHWNLRALGQLPVAFDPTFQWHYSPKRQAGVPRTMGVHGLWDDAALAANPYTSAADYVEARICDIRGLLPNAVEWMVDIETALHLRTLGVRLGERLDSEDCSLAVWTLHDEGLELLAPVLHDLFELEARTVITDAPLVVSAALGISPSVNSV